MKDSEIKEMALQYVLKSLKEGNDVVRCSAALALGKMGAHEAVGPLNECLLDDDPDLRYDAAWALGQLGDKRAVKPLIESLKEDGDPEVIKCAIDSLARIKDKEAVEPLIKALTFEEEFFDDFDEILDVNPQFDIQEKAALALGELRDSRAVGPLVEAIPDDAIYDMFGAVLLSLGKIRDEEGMKKIEELSAHSDPLIRRRAIKAMVNAEYPCLSERLTEALIDEDTEVKLISMEALANLAHNGKAPVPLVLLLQDKNREIRIKAAETVGKIMRDKGITHLFPLLGDNSAEVRARVAEILGTIGTDEVVDPLIVLLQEEKDEMVSEEAITALGKAGDERVIKYLIDLLKDKKGDYLRKRLIYAVGSIKCQKSLSALVEILKDKGESDQNKYICVERLQSFEGYGLEDLLKRAIEEEEISSQKVDEEGKEEAKELKGEKEEEGKEEGKEEKDVSPGIKIWVVRTLKGNRSHDAEEILLDLLKDDDQQVRKEAAISLASIGNEDALKVLIPEMPTEESSIDREIIEVIAYIDSKEVKEILLALLKNKNPEIRYYTIQALSQRGGDEAMAGLLELLDDENQVVRHEAVVALGRMKNSEGVEPLISHLFNLEEEHLKDDIINSLCQIGDKRIVDTILSRVSDNDDKDQWLLQSLAIEALGMIYEGS